MKDAITLYTGFSGVTATDIASFLGKELSTAESMLCNTFINSAEDYILRQCDKNFLVSLDNTDVEYEQTFDGGFTEYKTYNYPINEVTKIVVDGVTKYEKNETSEYALNSHFWVYPDKVVFQYMQYGSGYSRQSVKITHTIRKFWGEDVKLAIMVWVSEILTSGEHGGRNVTSASINGVSMTFDTKNTPELIKNVVNKYRRWFL